jgi:glycosyltransferase involved in cell wall biosynthesis
MNIIRTPFLCLKIIDMPKQKILLTNASDIYAGGEFYVFELARELLHRGYDVTVSCKPDNLLLEKCRAANINTISLDFPPTGHVLAYVKTLKRMINDHNIQIVHTNTNYDRTVGAFAAWMSGVVHVTNVHSFQSIQHNVTHWVRNRFATDHILVDGQCVKDLLVKKDNISPKKISVVHLGVDPELMKRAPDDRRRIRNEFGFSDDRVVIGNVARLVPFKGQEYLIKAFAHIAEKHPRAQLLLVGDGILHEEYINLVHALQLDGRVTFAGFRDDLTAVYSAFDLYVHPSIEGGGETFPFAVLQALSQELPVVVTNVGDVPAMVEEGKNGFVVPEKNPDAIAEKLNTFLNDSSLTQNMAKRSRKMLLDEFTTGKMVDIVVSVYEKIWAQTKH